ncbi:GMC family oxidoreductase [Salipiger mucosus]|uniref:Choline dehydrogenase n=1 Tax=Salipiger mucosus DSM 16094 TaxID=1123237 RepID=S9SFT4_9RHOB|nr:GMC family oxidoreductase N-terminal domain-containing protein [Salipiger mucosus]EPX85114.1 Choline dehydrogenase [Salipiger mucosus DSM 16094]
MPTLNADVIVIGSGSAGATAAGRIAMQGGARVMVIEAGGRDWNPLLRVPLMTGILLRNRYANWFYHTEPEPNLGNRRIFWPRGKVLGGSSAINGMVWTRGLPSDYDHWAQMGLPDWSWDKVLRSYREIEGHWAGETEVHGGSGPQRLSTYDAINPLSQAFLDAGQQAGHARTSDFNGPAPDGVGRYDYTISGGRRMSAASAFLDPAKEGGNLQVLTGARVLRIVTERGRATGVELAIGRRRVTVHAGHEIILSAGTVNSPQILMLSGIGPADALRGHGIDVVADSPGVGQNLRDHLLVRVEYDCTQPVTLHNLLRADRAGMALLEALGRGTGPAARFPLEAGAFLRSDPALDEADLQAHFLPGRSTAAVRMPFGGQPDRGHGFFANVYQMRPDSTGEIALRSADPFDAPSIRPNYLSAPRDLAVLRSGVRQLREIFAQPAFDAFRGAECAPGPDRQTDAELDAWIRQVADTVFHPVGTCRMGADPASVVDGQLRLRGIEGLRVADASVMPTMPSCNTGAPSQMIGAKAADFVIADLTGKAVA